MYTYRDSTRIWDWAVKASLSFWTKEREAGVWDFKEKVGNSQVDEQEQTCGKQILLGHSETMGHGESNKQTVWFLSVCHD